ncbi:helix-turn-helix transcriptional regulator [Catenulispora sp. NL8]|uniref:Helix-turn-helix transcriptional regulator n=1 Tax=Catenulispora pinistramenti TaxID=2705254 RepID=A0ABS5L891_9ACTN|nr:helix-turn-helix transcriptional regulator [Catenulispora pinistramenti]MBS2554577.1 helix-turn-helix transcriptional regulator [Catenulispora pinistramenti]
MTHRTIDASHDPIINEMYEGLRARLRRIRQNANISQRTIALEIGMYTEMFCRLDNGAFPAEGPHFAVWARSLGRRLAIADETGYEPPEPIVYEPGVSFLRYEYLRVAGELRERRLAGGVLITELADFLGCSASHLGNLEKARIGRFVASRTLMAWCHYLGCRIELAVDKELQALVLQERAEIAGVLNRGVLGGRDFYPRPVGAGSAAGPGVGPAAGSAGDRRCEQRHSRS